MAAQATLGDIPFRAGPDEVRWDYRMKTAIFRTVAGKVFQILGCELGDLVLTGTFGDGRKEDRGGWEADQRFHRQVQEWAKVQKGQSSPDPVRFTYRPRGWDFQVHVVDIAPIQMAVRNINPRWQLTLFIVDEASRKIVEGITDLYIKRLMDGIGWKQTDYNGPSSAEVDALLGGGSLTEHLAQQAQQAYNAGLTIGQ